MAPQGTHTSKEAKENGEPLVKFDRIRGMARVTEVGMGLCVRNSGRPHGGARDFRVRKEDVLEHNPTEGCSACDHAVGPEGAVRTGGHNARCRKRFA